jgi:hypothetical protein
VGGGSGAAGLGADSASVGGSTLWRRFGCRCTGRTAEGLSDHIGTGQVLLGQCPVGFQREQAAAAKSAKPDQQLRLAKKRLEEARRRRTGHPIKFAILLLPILAGAVFADSWLVRHSC